MATVTGKPYPGPFQIDLTDVKDDLIDLPDGAMKGLRAEQAGMDEVVKELARVMKDYGEEAGISPKVYAQFVEGTAKIDKLWDRELELEKAYEVTKETRAKKEHDRENHISMMVDSVKSTVKRTGDKSLLATFEKLIRYNAQIAEKAAQTRRENAEAREEAEKEEKPE